MKNRIEAEFPILKTTTYLNTAASGLLSKSVLDFRKDHDEQFFKYGSKFKDYQSEMLSQTREAVGSFFTCEPNQIALVQNFSLGFNTFLEVLGHEMVHLWQYSILGDDNCNHNIDFYKWRRVFGANGLKLTLTVDNETTNID